MPGPADGACRAEGKIASQLEPLSPLREEGLRGRGLAGERRHDEARLRSARGLECEIQLALRDRDVRVVDEIALREGAVAQAGVEKRERLLLVCTGHRQSRGSEEVVRPREPAPGAGDQVRVVGHEHLPAGQLRDRFAQVALPERERVDLALVRSRAQRRRDDLERVAVHEHDRRGRLQQVVPEPQRQARSGVLPHPGRVWKRTAKRRESLRTQVFQPRIPVPVGGECEGTAHVGANRREDPRVHGDERHALPVARRILGRRGDQVGPGRQVQTEKADQARRSRSPAAMHAEHENTAHQGCEATGAGGGLASVLCIVPAP